MNSAERKAILTSNLVAEEKPIKLVFSHVLQNFREDEKLVELAFLIEYCTDLTVDMVTGMDEYSNS